MKKKLLGLALLGAMMATLLVGCGSSGGKKGDTKDDVLDLLDQIERGFDDIEHRIANMDKEHAKYVRATVTRLNYLLSGETDTKGLVVQLLNRMSQTEDAQ